MNLTITFMPCNNKAVNLLQRKGYRHNQSLTVTFVPSRNQGHRQFQQDMVNVLRTAKCHFYATQQKAVKLLQRKGYNSYHEPNYYNYAIQG